MDNNSFLLKNLKIIHINVNSLISLSRRFDLQKFLEKHNPDIVLLNETKLNPRHKLKFFNYVMIRKDRPGATRGGGTAILIKSNIKYTVCTNNTINSIQILESCIVRIPMAENKNIVIISAYYPSGNNDTSFSSEFSNLFQALDLRNINNYYILAGDLNCRHRDWSNPTDNIKGKKLKDWLVDNEIDYRCKFYASEMPSYPKSNSYIDVCIADCRLHIITKNSTLNCLETLDYDSDHQALQICAYMNNEYDLFSFIEEPQNVTYDYKRTDWKKFRYKIIQKLDNNTLIPKNRNLSNSEIDNYIDKLNNLIVNAIEKATPKTKKVDYFKKTKSPIVQKLHQEKSKILTIIKKHNRLEFTLPETSLNLLRSQLKLIKKTFKRKHNQSFKQKYTR